jgi:hypothetical protein
MKELVEDLNGTENYDWEIDKVKYENGNDPGPPQPLPKGKGSG